MTPPHPHTPKNKQKNNKKNWIKKSSQWESNLKEPKKISLWFCNPPRYHLSYLESIDQLCINLVMKG